MDEKTQDELVDERLRADSDRKWRHRRLRVGRRNRQIRRERWRRSVRIAVPLLIVFGGLCAYFGYQASSLNRVATVRVTPASSSKLLGKELPIEPGDNLALVKRDFPRVQRQLQQRYPQLNRLTLTAAGNQITAHAEIAQPRAWFERHQQWYALYPNGRIEQQQPVEAVRNRSCQIQGVTERKQLEELGQQLGRLSKKEATNVQTITSAKDAGRSDKVHLQLRDGNQIITFASQVATKLKDYQRLKLTLKQPSIVHMEYGAYATPIR
ncbi:hypothetical protein [Fructilactobacillus carniphilus]|uniref:POTRA domain-containing protein n=1 Tax=Fructilactobacillus carniphilus TaxID=2940297 RepID=A0ABY5BWL4_9LACO|nr:hypothetical protein [Fructilactobacillus carniphilus]USS90894.1 hypothetical protein M3M37_01430 [Fructilactobacillus carniphilus]